MQDYQQLATEATAPRQARNLEAAWGRCHSFGGASDLVLDRIKTFCQRKHISIKALEEMETRFSVRGAGPDLFIAWAGRGRVRGEKVITGIKYRHLDTGKRYAEPGSVWDEPIIVGDRNSRDWFLTEGETDTARLFDLVGDVAAIMCLPAGALTIKQEWLALIPGGATAYLSLDADPPGDMGAAKAERLLYQPTIRVRPPDPYKDWCDWPGDRDDFIGAVQKAKAGADAVLRTADELLIQYADEHGGLRPPVRLGWGTIDSELKGISDGQVLGVAARTAVGKTWALASIADFTASSGTGGLILSLEMPGTDWIERQLAISENVAPEQVEAWIKQGVLQDRSKAFRLKFRNTLFCEKIVSLDEMGTLVQQAKRRMETDLRVVFVDYLGLVGARGKDIYERTSTVGKGLKQLAKRESVAVVVALQVSRLGGDGSKEITLEMLRDSGVLEESLDFLLGCWRPEKSPIAPEDLVKEYKDVLSVRVLKNRKGPEGRLVNLRFMPNSRKVYEPALV